jgi:N-acyl-L-homoserine lactone synthetase
MRIHLHGGAFGHVNEEMIENMYRLRHKVFAENLHWVAPVRDQLEIDRFDVLGRATVYIICAQENDVLGAARLLPTTSSTMLEKIFPELLGGEPMPQGPQIWESTRFVVRRAARTRVPDLPPGGVTSCLLAAMWELAMAIGLTEIVSVFALAMERILKRAGCVIQPIGVKRMIGTTETMAGLFPVSQERLEAIRRAGGITSPLIDPPGAGGTLRV